MDDADLGIYAREHIIRLPALSECARTEILDALGGGGDRSIYRERPDIASLALKSLGISESDLKSLTTLHCERNGVPFDQGNDYASSYIIHRRTTSGDKSEAYRFHFDSHLITVLVPLSIPEGTNQTSGSLIVFPAIRKLSKNSFLNVISKTLFKLFASRLGFLFLKSVRQSVEVDLSTYEPLIFAGCSSLHGNFPFTEASAPDRQVLLMHFYDAPDHLGVGQLIRRIRSR